MTTSTYADAPRGMEFLYSLNRLNVATSRAKCVCIVVASPKLFEAECKTPRQMRFGETHSVAVWELAHLIPSMSIRRSKAESFRNVIPSKVLLPPNCLNRPKLRSTWINACFVSPKLGSLFHHRPLPDLVMVRMGLAVPDFPRTFALECVRKTCYYSLHEAGTKHDRID